MESLGDRSLYICFKSKLRRLQSYSAKEFVVLGEELFADKVWHLELQNSLSVT
jgi:hypothetical protein